MISNCCGACSEEGEDHELCPDCKEHCDWEDDEIEEETED